jgi:hypothetical protein
MTVTSTQLGAGHPGRIRKGRPGQRDRPRRSLVQRIHRVGSGFALAAALAAASAVVALEAWLAINANIRRF